uniref:Uncharacterized protein n=1 Tax=Haptolina brevifila TaxID=156173 RepID=A0A7S2GHW0_9EUKA
MLDSFSHMLGTGTHISMHMFLPRCILQYAQLDPQAARSALFVANLPTLSDATGALGARAIATAVRVQAFGLAGRGQARLLVSMDPYISYQHCSICALAAHA